MVTKTKRRSTAKPQKKGPTKLQKRLNARVADFAQMMTSGGPAAKRQASQPGAYHQPGSFK